MGNLRLAMNSRINLSPAFFFFVNVAIGKKGSTLTRRKYA